MAMSARKKTFLIRSVVFIALLALASFITGQKVWDGGWPSARVRVVVTNEAGETIEGASLTMFLVEHGKRVRNFDPLKNPPENPTGFVTGPDGSIESDLHDGLSFGGRTWLLFWCIPIKLSGDKPDVRCEVAAEGFKPLEFPFESLLENKPADAKEKWEKNLRPTFETVHRLRR